MNVFIDESGSFASASNEGAFNAIAALALPEISRRGLIGTLGELKSTLGRPAKSEIKINEISENIYIAFLKKLSKLNGALFSVVTDAGLNSPLLVADHQRRQVESVLKHIDKMKYEGGRRGVELMATQLENLSPQLYVQLYCQIQLMYEVVSQSISYFVQRNPNTLNEFRWRIDQKNYIRTDFEYAFEKLSPAFLQTMSIEKPLFRVKEFDYSGLKRYEFPDGKMPAYLNDTYHLNIN
jgi:hypothetical protein